MKENLEKYGRVLEGVDIKDHSTFKTSALIDYLVLPNSLENLKALILFLKQKNSKYKVIGKCSNLVFVTPHYEGVLIRLDFLDSIKFDGEVIKVGSGVSLMKLAFDLSQSGLTGLEWGTGIPGSVGGAIVQNAGCYGSDMASIVTSIKVLTENGSIEEWDKTKINFSYRSSYLKEHPEIICLEATIKLEKGNSKEIMASIQEKREKRFSSQPLDYPSCGSVFRNPEGISVWKLIEEAGLKGTKIGGAEVSEKHANFIINTGGATGADIKELVLLIQEKIKEKYKIDLIPEQEFVE